MDLADNFAKIVANVTKWQSLPHKTPFSHPPYLIWSNPFPANRLYNRQNKVPRAEDVEPLFKVGDKVWLKSFYKGRSRGAKLQPKYVGTYTVTKILPFQTYEMKRQGRKSVQHEGRIKLVVGDVVPDRQPAPPPEVSQDSPDTATIDTQSEDYYNADDFAVIVPPALVMPDSEPVPLTPSVIERQTPLEQSISNNEVLRSERTKHPPVQFGDYQMDKLLCDFEDEVFVKEGAMKWTWTTPK